jgi:hypothetical protein
MAAACDLVLATTLDARELHANVQGWYSHSAWRGCISWYLLIVFVTLVVATLLGVTAFLVMR